MLDLHTPLQATGDDGIVGDPAFTIKATGITGDAKVSINFGTGVPAVFTVANTMSGRNADPEYSDDGNVMTAKVTVSNA